MSTYVLIFVCGMLGLLIPVSFVRGIVGPSALDRIIVINVIGTKTVVIMVLISFLNEEYFFIDVAMVYALISFVASICVAKYLERGRIS